MLEMEVPLHGRSALAGQPFDTTVLPKMACVCVYVCKSVRQQCSYGVVCMFQLLPPQMNPVA